jgi:hypothetical protein
VELELEDERPEELELEDELELLELLELLDEAGPVAAGSLIQAVNALAITNVRQVFFNAPNLFLFIH